MAKIRLRLETTGPSFSKGADPKGAPEFRAPSIRGQLRYWLRALVGAEDQTAAKVWKRETTVFGSTESGSVVTVRVSGSIGKQIAESDEPNDNKNPAYYKPYLLPHRLNEREKSPDYAIRPKTKTTLSLLTRPGVPMPQDAINAVSLWLLLGGVGKRSRRMMGGLQPVKVLEPAEGLLPDWMRAEPQSVSDWAAWYGHELNRVIKVGASPSRIPDFPTLHPQHCCILVGERLFSNATEANQALFRELLRTKFLSDETMFGFAGSGGRRASPVIAQVRSVSGNYFPVLTIFRSPIRRPNGKSTDWSILNRFIDEVQTTFSTTIVYGGKFA